MNNYNMLESVYNDFFGSNNIKEGKILDEEVNLDDIFISEDSKLLLKKIILYMESYSLKKEVNYISFNIILDTSDDETISKVASILLKYADQYNYIDKKKINNLSLYNIKDSDNIDKIYNEYGVIVLKDVNVIGLKDTSFKSEFLYNLKDKLNDRNIAILTGKKSDIDSFLLLDNTFETNYFNFKIDSIKPSINDIYNRIINGNESNELNIKILDYITSTYPKSELDYSIYIKNILNYISFNKDVPKIDEIKSLDEVFKDLNKLVGLKKVKNALNDLVDLISLKNKTSGEVKINNVNLHMVFLGNPGTGKTTVARLLCEILYNLKYIKQNKLVEVSSKDLIAEYVGQTAVKTMDKINSALGGVLFIDEAYSLATVNNDNSFNAECIATLIKAMEDNRDNLVVIFAGYTKEMQDFLDSNSGIVSRIGYTLEFDDYTNEELKEIFKGMITSSGFILEEGAIDEVSHLIDDARELKNFGNARFIRNVYEKTVIRHASNTKNIKNKDKLRLITKKDICL